MIVGTRANPNVRVWVVIVAVALLASACTAQPNLAEFPTRHYLLHTDLSPAAADEISRRMDAMYEQYDRRLSDISSARRDDRRFQVYVFARRADYLKFTGADMTNTAGVFMADRGALAAFFESSGRDGMYRALQHEAFHQFAYGKFGRDLPVWVNEGMAQVFEEGI